MSGPRMTQQDWALLAELFEQSPAWFRAMLIERRRGSGVDLFFRKVVAEARRRAP